MRRGSGTARTLAGTASTQHTSCQSSRSTGSRSAVSRFPPRAFDRRRWSTTSDAERPQPDGHERRLYGGPFFLSTAYVMPLDQPTDPATEVAQADDDTLPRWVQAVVGVALTVILVPCLAGSVMLLVLPSEMAPVMAPAIGFPMTLLCAWLGRICYRLIAGRKIQGGLMAPQTLRAIAWLFLLLPLGGVFTGYFETHTLQAMLQSAAYVSVFFGLRGLATRRRTQVETDNE